MDHVTIEDIDPDSPPDENVPPGSSAESVGEGRTLTGHLGTEGLSINHYTLDPGESIWLAVHRHEAQEELFHVTDGTVTFETSDGAVVVSAGEVVRFPPGEWQLGTNEGEETARLLGLGAPRDYQGETELLLACEACGTETVHHIDPGEDAFAFCCAECGAIGHSIER